jgi:hypothetical protein
MLKYISKNNCKMIHVAREPEQNESFIVTEAILGGDEREEFDE